MKKQEIERKFLVRNEQFKNDAFKSESLIQGFLSSVPERTVRVRISGKKGFITVKGIGNESGTSRFEWEKIIGIDDAKSLLSICEPGMIEKTRYYVNVGRHVFEVDEFGLTNQGLILAEVELSHEEESFEKPSWLGAEVTGDPRYYNSSLARYPYSTW